MTCCFIVSMAFYVTVDSDLADKIQGQIVTNLATPLYFGTNDWKVAVLEYGFNGTFAEKHKLLHISCELVEMQLICFREERLLVSILQPEQIGQIPYFRTILLPQFKRVVQPHCAKLSFSFVTSEGDTVILPGSTHFFMTLVFDRI